MSKQDVKIFETYIKCVTEAKHCGKNLKDVLSYVAVGNYDSDSEFFDNAHKLIMNKNIPDTDKYKILTKMDNVMGIESDSVGPEDLKNYYDENE